MLDILLLVLFIGSLLLFLKSKKKEENLAFEIRQNAAKEKTEELKRRDIVNEKEFKDSYLRYRHLVDSDAGENSGGDNGGETKSL